MSNNRETNPWIYCVPKDRLLIAILGIANSNIIGRRYSYDDRSVTPLFRSFEEWKFCNSDATFSTTVPTSNYGPSATFGSSKDRSEVVHIVSLYSTLFYAITGNYHSTRDHPRPLFCHLRSRGQDQDNGSKVFPE
jgi:hypothetical protein